MSCSDFTKTELAAAIARGVRQCVVIGSRATLRELCKLSGEQDLQVFSVDEIEAPNEAARYVPTEFASEGLSSALQKSEFDNLKASLFVWLGGAGYRTVDAVVGALGFIASLPRGSSVVFDYAEERTGSSSTAQLALDALASRVAVAGGSVKDMINPQALSGLLRGMGFQKIVDLAYEEANFDGARLVSATV